MCCAFLSILYPNATVLFDLSPLPLIRLHPPTYNSSDTLGSHSHLKSHHPSNQSFIFPLAIFPSLPILIFSNGGNSCSESQLWSWSGRSIFFFFFSLPTYTAHLHGWTWWQPPPPRCQPCSSSDLPAPSGCPQCVVSHCRWMFPGTCLTHCLLSSSTVPEESGGKGGDVKKTKVLSKAVSYVKGQNQSSVTEKSWEGNRAKFFKNALL